MINLKKKQGQRALVLSIGIATLIFSIATVTMFWAPPIDLKRPERVPKTREGMPINEGFAALFRHLNASKACYHDDRNLFLVTFPEGYGEKWSNNWFVLEKAVFHEVDINGTYYLEEIESHNYTKVWPDVSKMLCADAPKA